MFEEIIRKEIEIQKDLLKFSEAFLERSESEIMMFYWLEQKAKHEFAIDTLNGVLNLVYLT